MLCTSVLALLYSAPVGPGLFAPEQPPGSRLLAQYAEAVERIRRDALFADGSSAESIVSGSLKAYLAQHDPYSDYLDASEYASFRQAAGASYVGIGMELEKRRDGSVYCYPLAGSPAAAAGIRPGEQLAAVNGVEVRGKSLVALAVLARGAAGTALTLDIAGADGRTRRVAVTRVSVSARTVSDYSHGSLRIIRLSSFGPDTRRELDYLLSGWNPRSPVVIDLRGCGGGDFHAAIDAAMLFLQRDAPIAAVHRRSKVSTYASTLARPATGHRVFLWQDASTASAAEVFIAALAENGRAISIGATSAGKGTLQDIIALDGGAALVLTTGFLTTPRGKRFDGQGLAPARALAAGSTTDDYARIVGAESGKWKPIP